MRTEIEHYLSQAGTDPFQRWLDGLADLRCRVAVLRRIDRMADGNPGDQRFCRDGVWQLRIDCGPGYRVYFARPSKDRVLLLCGGSKRSQSAAFRRRSRAGLITRSGNDENQNDQEAGFA
jgi:putative addiction module killer protein